MSRSLSALGLAVLALLLVCSAPAVGAEESPHLLPRSCPDAFAASGPAGGKVACTRQVTVAHVCPPDSVAAPCEGSPGRVPATGRDVVTS